MATGTRDRIVHTSAELFRRQGYASTGLKQIVTQANAPFGSLYHFFPGGKEQLGEEVIRSAGAMYFSIFDAYMGAAPDLAGGVRIFFEGAAAVLEASDYADACPIATVALEVASTNEPLRIATADVFESWIDGVGQRFVDGGLEPAAARALAILLINLVEGAFVLCRAMRNTDPMRVAGSAAVAATQGAFALVGRREQPQATVLKPA